MSKDAVRCENCGKLRKDIYEDKVKSYTFCIPGGLGIGIGIGPLKYSSAQTAVIIIAVLAALVGIYFYVRVSQKLKSYWWA